MTDTVIEQRGKYSANNVYTYGVIHKFGCKIYDKSSMVLLSNYLLEDTVFELAQVSPWPYTTEDFSFDNTAWNTGVLAGEKYAHYLAPHWIDQTRIFYYGNNKTFKKAYLLVQEQQLDSAINLLKKEADLKPGTSRSLKSLHNMAVTYELKDDLNNAHKMADSVYNASFNKGFQRI
ncbi:MAG: hypothetical protein HC828_13985 [Blastochloris sp.]|nr:hypothetical protein [Blastochloris sp.]